MNQTMLINGSKQVGKKASKMGVSPAVNIVMYDRYIKGIQKGGSLLELAENRGPIVTAFTEKL